MTGPTPMTGKKGPGRPKGSTKSIWEDPDRYELALAQAFLDLPKYHGAKARGVFLGVAWASHGRPPATPEELADELEAEGIPREVIERLGEFGVKIITLRPGVPDRAKVGRERELAHRTTRFRFKNAFNPIVEDTFEHKLRDAQKRPDCARWLDAMSLCWRIAMQGAQHIEGVAERCARVAGEIEYYYTVILPILRVTPWVSRAPFADPPKK